MHTNTMNVKRANNPSYSLRRIVAAKQVLQQGLREKIGNGHDTKVWEEPWLQTHPAKPPSSAGIVHDEDIQVHLLFDTERHEWNLDIIKGSISAEDIPSLILIRVSKTGRHDSYIWDLTKLGYSVAHNIRMTDQRNLVSEPSTIGLKKEIWKIKAPRKIKQFLWQATAGYLATSKQLKDRHCTKDSCCMRCGAETESINHTLFECPQHFKFGIYPLFRHLREDSRVHHYMQI